MDRTEIGLLRFGSDATGVFIPGDAAEDYAELLAIVAMQHSGDPSFAGLAVLRDLLRSAINDRQKNQNDSVATTVRAFNRCNIYQCAVCGHFSECHVADASHSYGNERCGNLVVCAEFVE